MISSKAPLLRYLSKWFIIGGLLLIAFAVFLVSVASTLPTNWCSGYPLSGWCTEQDGYNYEIKAGVGEIAVPMIWLGSATAIIAFIAWINVRRW